MSAALVAKASGTRGHCLCAKDTRVWSMDLTALANRDPWHFQAKRRTCSDEKYLDAVGAEDAKEDGLRRGGGVYVVQPWTAGPEKSSAGKARKAAIDLGLLGLAGLAVMSLGDYVHATILG